MREKLERKEEEEKNIWKTAENLSDGIKEKNELYLNKVKFFENEIAREREVSLFKSRWLTTSEAAQYLRISISSLKTMIYRGQVRVHKLGRRNRFLTEELERLISLPVHNRR